MERPVDSELGIFAYYTLAYCHTLRITLPLRPLSSVFSSFFRLGPLSPLPPHVAYLYVDTLT